MTTVPMPSIPTRRRVTMLVRNAYTNDTRVEREAASLRDAGYEVTVVAEHRAGLPRRELRDGISVLRVPRRGPNVPGLRFFAHLWRLGRAVVRTGPDVLHAHDTDALQVVGPVAGRLGVPFVYDAHELWLGLGARGRPGWYAALARAYYRLVERRYIPRAAATFVANPPVAGELRRRYGVRDVRELPNYPADEIVGDEPPARDLRELPGGSELPAGQQFVIHVGGFTPNRGLEQLVEAMTQLPGRHLAFLGAAGPHEAVIRGLAVRLGVLDQVHFVAPVPSVDVVPYAATATVGVAVNQPSSLNNRLALPNKVFQYMAAGLPLVVSDFPQLRQVIEEVGCGIAVDPTDPVAIADAIRVYLDDPERARREGWAARAAVRDRYHWKVAARTLVDAYRSLDTAGSVADD